MRTKQWLSVAVVVFCGILLVNGWPRAQEASAPDAKPADEAARKAEQEYAKAYLRLAEATLAKYQETNKKLPNSIRGGVMQALVANVANAKARVKHAGRAIANDTSNFVDAAEARLRLSEESLRKAEQVNKQGPGTITSAELDRLKAEVGLARARLDLAKHLDQDSPLSSIHYELEQLREDVQDLRLNVALLRDRN